MADGASCLFSTTPFPALPPPLNACDKGPGPCDDDGRTKYCDDEVSLKSRRPPMCSAGVVGRASGCLARGFCRRDARASRSTLATEPPPPPSKGSSTPESMRLPIRLDISMCGQCKESPQYPPPLPPTHTHTHSPPHPQLRTHDHDEQLHAATQ